MSGNAAKETETLMRLNFTQQSKIVVEISRCGQKKRFFVEATGYENLQP